MNDDNTKTNNCVFCKIVEKEIPAHIVYEDENFLAFLDSRPQSPGHTQVIPKRHIRWVWDVENTSEYFGIAKKIALAQRKAFHTDFREQGKDIGSSMVSDEKLDLSSLVSHPKLLLPVDGISQGDAIMDAGMQTVELLRKEIEKAKYILWNGPLGAYETGYRSSTLQLAEMLAEATRKGTKTIVGGGDTLATIAELKLENSFTFVSTGGGAMLDFLAKGTLPGIEALKNSKV